MTEKREPFKFPVGPLPDHYAAIGRLITSFSMIEGRLNEIMRGFLGLPDEIGRLVTGEMRTDDLMSALRRIAKAKKFSSAKMLIVPVQLSQVHEMFWI